MQGHGGDAGRGRERQAGTRRASPFHLCIPGSVRRGDVLVVLTTANLGWTDYGRAIMCPSPEGRPGGVCLLNTHVPIGSPAQIAWRLRRTSAVWRHICVRRCSCVRLYSSLFCCPVLGTRSLITDGRWRCTAVSFCSAVFLGAASTRVGFVTCDSNEYRCIFK